MVGEYWRVSTWYKNDPNRYVSIILQYQWDFEKRLDEMEENEIVHLITDQNIKFKVKLCKFTYNLEQSKYCKILERIE
jgi:hypothetical protein